VAIDPPVGTVTFLFTDLEGSTRLWEEHPDAMQGALRRHDELLQHAVEAHGGYVVKTTGDGIHAAFATADAAVAAAVSGQRTLLEEDWEATGPLKVRMGLHTGAAELREGDYFGPAVNRAARLMAAAHGGQIIMSNATEELVRDALDPSVGIEDLGEHRLKDLGRAERVFQVKASGLPSLFPALRTLDAYPGNLPVLRTAFVGRHKELTELPELLRDAAIVTLTGPGGVGKTRLALQMAAAAVPDHPDGAWFVDLAPVTDPDLVPWTVLTALRLAQTRSGLVEEMLLASLRDQAVLIILDNCEHVVDAVADLVGLLAPSCPRIALLLTSREAIGVEGERVVPVAPLPLPTSGAAGIDELGANDAVALFVDRARAARHGFVLTAENSAAVTELTRRLDGIPLAIELAAARVRVMSPADIATRLDERFRLLTHGRRTALGRHQTLRAAIDWSYMLLDELEQLVFARLAVFTGGCTLDAAESIVTDERVDRFDVLDLLAGLAGKSMIVVDEEHGSARYRVLETLREYGQERLAEFGEADRLQALHCRYYLDFAEEAGRHFKLADDAAWVTKVETELDNLRAALVWGDEHDVTVVERLVRALALYWHQTKPREGWEWARLAVAADDARARATRPELLAVLAMLSGDSGYLDPQSAYASIECSHAAGEPPLALAFSYLSNVLLQQNDPEGSRRFAEESQAAARAHQGLFELADALATTSLSYTFTGDETRGAELADEALDVAERLGNSFQLGNAQLSAGMARCRTDPEAAVRFFEMSGAWRAHLDRRGVRRTFEGLARMHCGDLQGAARDLQGALTDVRVGENDYFVRMITQVVTGLLLVYGRTGPATRLLSATEHIRASADIPGAPREVEDHSRLRHRLEQATGADVFAAEWAAGQSMSLSDAGDFAHRQLAEIAESP
jgi:predicted ATPase/class 3 adenylate cyclase